MTIATTDTVRQATGWVDYAVHDLDIVRYHIPWFDALSPAEKLRELRALDADDVIAEASQPNTTCVGLDEARVITANYADGRTEAARYIAVGTGAHADITPQYEDEQLPNQVDRTTIADYQIGGDATTITYNGFLAANQANVSEQITRVGVISTGERLYNHSEITPFEKDSNRGVSLRVTLSFGPDTTS